MTPDQKKAREIKDAAIRDRFHYKKPTPVHQMWFDDVTRNMDRLVDLILFIPDSQERAVALTQLSLARMCINAAIANTAVEQFEEYDS